MPARSLVAAASVAVALVLTAACSDAPADAARSQTPTGSASAVASTPAGPSGQRVAGVGGKRVEVVAVGDIACAPGDPTTSTRCRQGATANLTKRIDPRAVLALGDLQYETGRLSAFRNSYDKSWGALKSITYPTPGNHEYRTAGANGYYTYFDSRQPGAPGYYAFNLGRWRAYALNGNCTKIDCGKQAEWFEKDLEANPRACSMLTTHFPRYSTGEHGNNEFMRRFVKIAFRHHVDLMVAGHDHHYERFRPMNHKGDVVNRGVVQFVSGGGGKSHYDATGSATGSEVVVDKTFGVLRLVLRPGSYSYGFRGIDGSSRDNGSRDCV